MMNLNYNITLSNGNKKLKNTDSTRFIIFNLPSIVTCPYATIHCKEKCYARKSELFYPDVLPCRNRNLQETKKDSFVPDMVARIENKIKTKSYQEKQIVIRIHESGDFYNKTYAKKWLSIASYFENNKNIVFMAYTKSLIYFEDENIPINFCLRASVWDDTKTEQKELIYKNDYPIYTALSGEKIQEMKKNNIPFYECKCADCGNCGKCWDKSEKKIIVKIH